VYDYHSELWLSLSLWVWLLVLILLVIILILINCDDTGNQCRPESESHTPDRHEDYIDSYNIFSKPRLDQWVVVIVILIMSIIVIATISIW